MGCDQSKQNNANHQVSLPQKANAKSHSKGLENDALLYQEDKLEPERQYINKNQVIISKKTKTVQQAREVLEMHVNFEDDYLIHHLKYELTLCRFTSTSRIRKRQILEHFNLLSFWGSTKAKGININNYMESANTAWLQRTFLDIWEVAHDEFFNQGIDEKLVRRKVAEQYMFEIYELKEFVDAGLGDLNDFCSRTRCDLFYFLQFSDDGLFNIFKRLKDRYPQTGQTEKIDFPEVPSTKTSMNLLQNFPSKAYVDPPHINIQTIYEDVSLLLRKAIELQDAFKEDMKEILGSDALACPKVTQVVKDGVPEFNACAVRRVFVKWAENLLEACPDLLTSKAFLQFVRAKAEISNNFFFKSTVQKSTHKIVIDTICYLIEVAKYNLADQTRRKEFVFNIYDLLRCKVKRNSPNEIVDLLRKMEGTKVTKNGHRFEVLRVKNRFKTNNRDLLINFRYGDVLVGEAQLCMDDANVSKLTKHNYEFCHYIYELERSLFGPTLELMMQYEDYQRPDISVSFEAEGLVYPRENQIIQKSQHTNRVCLQGHPMIGLIGNYFSDNDPEQQVLAHCNFCDRVNSSKVMYDYCFHCNCYLCRECLDEYSEFNPKNNWLSIEREDIAVLVTDSNHVKSQCALKKSLIVLFYIENNSCNQLFKDALIYHQCKLAMQPNTFVSNLALANCSNPNLNELTKIFNIQQFPTLILFDQNAHPVRTLVGFCWLQVPLVVETQRNMLERNSISIELTCPACTQEETPINLIPIQQMQLDIQLCLCCFNSNKPINLPKEYQTLGGICKNNHYKCIVCCYAALDIPSTFKDHKGSAFLCSLDTLPILNKCPKGHTPKLSKVNTFEVWEYFCYGCNNTKFFDDQNGVGICEECKTGLCAKCMGLKGLTLQQKIEIDDLGAHYVESAAQQGALCICDRPFKKSYSTRILSLNQFIQKCIEEGKQWKWKCQICQKIGQEGRLHLACFNCPALFDPITQKKSNFEVCMNCAAKTELLLREAQEKVREEPSFFVCPNRHFMIKSSLAYDQQLTYDCLYCRRKYFGNTERFYCKTCKVNCCNDCVGKLMNANAPQCNQYCKSKHSLTLFYRPKRLEFCAGCLKSIRKEHFKCVPCAYALCLNCSKSQKPLLGNAYSEFLQSLNTNPSFQSKHQIQAAYCYGLTKIGYQYQTRKHIDEFG